MLRPFRLSAFFCMAPAPTEIYTLSLHDALPISSASKVAPTWMNRSLLPVVSVPFMTLIAETRSEEHTFELQSLTNLVCRLLLEKKNQTMNNDGMDVTFWNEPQQGEKLRCDSEDM